MNTEGIARSFHAEITKANGEIFRERYLEIDPATMKAGGFQEESRLCQGLSDSDKNTILKIIRQVSVDTASTILGLIEGSTTSPTIDGEFSLIYNGVEVGRDIQTEFLIIEQGVTE